MESPSLTDAYALNDKLPSSPMDSSFPESFSAAMAGYNYTSMEDFYTIAMVTGNDTYNDYEDAAVWDVRATAMASFDNIVLASFNGTAYNERTI